MDYTFEVRLKEVLNKKKMSVKELAALSGVSKSELYYICSGKHKPSLEIMLVLAKLLDVELSELYYFQENCPK